MAKKAQEEKVVIPDETNEEIERRLEKYKASLLKQAGKNDGKLQDRLGPVPKSVPEDKKDEYRGLRRAYQDAKFVRTQLLEKMQECQSGMSELKG